MQSHSYANDSYINVNLYSSKEFNDSKGAEDKTHIILNIEKWK